MVFFNVTIKRSGEEDQTLELETTPETTKVGQLSRLMGSKLGTDISAEIAVGEKVLVGDARLRFVEEGATYTLFVLGSVS